MLPEFLLLHRRADPAFSLLSPGEQTQIQTTFTTLYDLPSSDWKQEGASQLDTPDRVWIVRIHANLLVYFQPLPERRFLIEDFVRQPFLDSFARARSLHEAQRA
jgi:hypothetical protein